ncbi:MAG: TldD/PmbA family protein [Lachnospiraceae bacterium]|nr:TldD/PmbA family protein [Lachnospiraceae bacterium]
MTTDQLKQILQESGADAWEIRDTRTAGWEFYFIRHQLDQNRVRDVEHIEVKVYRALENGTMLGNASAEIAPTATEEEARRMIDGLCRDAEYAVNPFYRLNPPAPLQEETRSEIDPAAISRDFIKAMAEMPETDQEDLNSYEIFADRCVTRFVNSEGIDVTQTYPASMIEVVVNARDTEHEIELYRLYHAGTCDRDALRRDITELMRFGRDRLKAQPTPALGTASVLFSTQDAVRIYEWFGSRMKAANKYMKLSDWEIGRVYAEELTGDPVTLTARAFLPGSSQNRLFDDEGAPVHDFVIIDKGTPVSYWGSRQFRSYLGVENGYTARNFEVSGGTGTEESLRGGSYLEVVEFSDFSVDNVTGDFAGEIRLGYWHDGGETVSVTGGSVSGSLREMAGGMRFSAEQRQYDNYLIPGLTRLENVRITGIDHKE